MWTLLGLMTLLVAQVDPDEIVVKLGSPRFNEREEATEALKKLGANALPALREASQSNDAEQKTRATQLIDEIEARLMIEPSLVKLAYVDRSINEVVRDLSEQANVNVVLFPENAPSWESKRITLQSQDPVPFWEAVDRLCRESGAVVSNANHMIQFQPGQQAQQAKKRLASLQLLANNGIPGPSSVSGPFRSVATNVLHHKDRIFNQNGFPVGQVAQPANGQVAAPNGRPVPVAGMMTETFGVGVQINCEPKLSMLQNGNVRIIEAIDEQGRSLAPAVDPAAGNRFQGQMGFNGMAGGSSLQFQVMLNLPASPGKLVKRLKLAVPVVLMARRNDPYLVNLADFKGKTFEAPTMTIQIHEIKDDPNQPSTTIDLTVKMRKQDGQLGPNQAGLEFAAFRFNPGQSQSQVEIVDNQGRLFTQWFSINPQPGNDGTRMGLRLMPNEGVGPPAEIRLYDMGRAESEAIFELHDIPMP